MFLPHQMRPSEFRWRCRGKPCPEKSEFIFEENQATSSERAAPEGKPWRSLPEWSFLTNFSALTTSKRMKKICEVIKRTIHFRTIHIRRTESPTLTWTRQQTSPSAEAPQSRGAAALPAPRAIAVS
ncbi:hypothetical protein AV530_019130 [Patagioenas fasciata monilis]|uniref:Uncharacterized protein n=1 Tax=Patagioenas fasciata monilis TaxID=372326 RepID=A0A1V4KX03_PATFA|nr:hypothetical protein AV530_019130 [Patagioenas fasciata monilis]